MKNYTSLLHESMLRPQLTQTDDGSKLDPLSLTVLTWISYAETVDWTVPRLLQLAEELERLGYARRAHLLDGRLFEITPEGTSALAVRAVLAEGRSSSRQGAFGMTATPPGYWSAGSGRGARKP